MNGNQIAENIIELIPKVIEDGINVLIPKEIQIWFENNYKLIGLIMLTLFLLSLTIAIIKDILKDILKK